MLFDEFVLIPCRGFTDSDRISWIHERKNRSRVLIPCRGFTDSD